MSFIYNKVLFLTVLYAHEMNFLKIMENKPNFQTENNIAF